MKKHTIPDHRLVWARKELGITQAQAAAKMKVDRMTFSRWESGAQPMPARQWKRFIDITGLDERGIPKPLEYNAEGYPIGFDRTPYLADEMCDGKHLWDLEEEALAKIEGAEHEARSDKRMWLACEGWVRKGFIPELMRGPFVKRWTEHATGKQRWGVFFIPRAYYEYRYPEQAAKDRAEQTARKK